MRLTWGLLCLLLVAVFATFNAVANPPDPPPPPNYEDTTSVEPGTLSYPPFFQVGEPPPGDDPDEWNWFWWKEFCRDTEFYVYYDELENTWCCEYDPWRVWTPEDQWRFYYWEIVYGVPWT